MVPDRERFSFIRHDSTLLDCDALRGEDDVKHVGYKYT